MFLRIQKNNSAHLGTTRGKGVVPTAGVREWHSCSDGYLLATKAKETI